MTPDPQARRLGLLGGMAWPSTAAAYRQLNEAVAARLGGHHSARLLVWSVDFAEVEALQAAGDWDTAGALLADAGARLETAGAGALLLCTNTMHVCAPAIEAAVDVPLIHIADATADAVRAAGANRVGLLGTRYTMEQDFYRGRLRAHGLDVIVPDAPARTAVHDIIFGELVHGIVDDRSRQVYRRAAADLVDRGAEAVIAGCTEIELLLQAEDVDVAYVPTTSIHVQAGAAWLLDGTLPATP